MLILAYAARFCNLPYSPEIPSPKPEGNPNAEIRNRPGPPRHYPAGVACDAGLGFRISFGFRFSAFGFPISPIPADSRLGPLAGFRLGLQLILQLLLADFRQQGSQGRTGLQAQSDQIVSR